jgi:hypothetical protein
MLRRTNSESALARVGRSPRTASDRQRRERTDAEQPLDGSLHGDADLGGKRHRGGSANGDALLDERGKRRPPDTQPLVTTAQLTRAFFCGGLPIDQFVIGIVLGSSGNSRCSHIAVLDRDHVDTPADRAAGVGCLSISAVQGVAARLVGHAVVDRDLDLLFGDAER